MRIFLGCLLHVRFLASAIELFRLQIKKVPAYDNCCIMMYIL